MNQLTNSEFEQCIRLDQRKRSSVYQNMRLHSSIEDIFTISKTFIVFKADKMVNDIDVGLKNVLLIQVTKKAEGFI